MFWNRISLPSHGYPILRRLCSSVWQGYVEGHDAGQSTMLLWAPKSNLHLQPELTSIMSGLKEVSDKEGVKVRVEVMMIIFVVSLFGLYSYSNAWIILTTYKHPLSPRYQSVSRFFVFLRLYSSSGSILEQVSCRASGVRNALIPGFLGVILSTAFVHLLQDAFSSLQDPNVEARYHLRHWTGLIVYVDV